MLYIRTYGIESTSLCYGLTKHNVLIISAPYMCVHSANSLPFFFSYAFNERNNKIFRILNATNSIIGGDTSFFGGKAR